MQHNINQQQLTSRNPIPNPIPSPEEHGHKRTGQVEQDLVTTDSSVGTTVYPQFQYQNSQRLPFPYLPASGQTQILPSGQQHHEFIPSSRSVQADIPAPTASTDAPGTTGTASSTTGWISSQTDEMDTVSPDMPILPSMTTSMTDEPQYLIVFVRYNDDRSHTPLQMVS